MLNPEPRTRITIADALRHPWVTQDLDPRLASINSSLLIAGGAAAFCMPGGPHAGGFPQNPVDLARVRPACLLCCLLPTYF